LRYILESCYKVGERESGKKGEVSVLKLREKRRKGEKRSARGRLCTGWSVRSLKGGRVKGRGRKAKRKRGGGRLGRRRSRPDALRVLEHLLRVVNGLELRQAVVLRAPVEVLDFVEGQVGVDYGWKRG
jgi:hypothetical protein